MSQHMTQLKFQVCLMSYKPLVTFHSRSIQEHDECSAYDSVHISII
jgi:hypothetical protein